MRGSLSTRIVPSLDIGFPFGTIELFRNSFANGSYPPKYDELDRSQCLKFELSFFFCIISVLFNYTVVSGFLTGLIISQGKSLSLFPKVLSDKLDGFAVDLYFWKNDNMFSLQILQDFAQNHLIGSDVLHASPIEFSSGGRHLV